MIPYKSYLRRKESQVHLQFWNDDFSVTDVFKITSLLPWKILSKRKTFFCKEPWGPGGKGWHSFPFGNQTVVSFLCNLGNLSQGSLPGLGFSCGVGLSQYPTDLPVVLSLGHQWYITPWACTTSIWVDFNQQGWVWEKKDSCTMCW